MSATWTTRRELLPREAITGAALAATSGAAIVVAAFTPVPLSFTAPAIVLPAALIVVGVALTAWRQPGPLHTFSRLVFVGAAAGLIATLAYDAIRPALRAVFGFTFDPYRAVVIFGTLITGRVGTDPLALAAGWTYHFWNGISFGVMYALIRPRGGPLTGLMWAVALQGLMLVVYPTFLQARLDDPGFLTLGLIGHGVWGLVLGYLVKRWRADA